MFLKRAGTVIFAVAVVIWALAYFPRAEEIPAGLDENTAAAVQMEQSWLADVIRGIEGKGEAGYAYPSERQGLMILRGDLGDLTEEQRYLAVGRLPPFPRWMLDRPLPSCACEDHRGDPPAE